MLVLTRGKEQTVKIGDNVEIKIVKLEGGTVKLGITAPPNVLILRGELEKRSVHAPQSPQASINP